MIATIKFVKHQNSEFIITTNDGFRYKLVSPYDEYDTVLAKSNVLDLLVRSELQRFTVLQGDLFDVGHIVKIVRHRNLYRIYDTIPAEIIKTYFEGGVAGQRGLQRIEKLKTVSGAYFEKLPQPSAASTIKNKKNDSDIFRLLTLWLLITTIAAVILHTSKKE